MWWNIYDKIQKYYYKKNGFLWTKIELSNEITEIEEKELSLKAFLYISLTCMRVELFDFQNIKK